MAIRTRWACKLGLWALLGLFACAKKPPVPTLTAALATPGGAAEKAKACLKVVVAGPPEERREAALLWGLYACDAGSPASALRAFSLAQPTGGPGAVAARRLEEAARRAPSAALVAQLQNASWLSTEGRERVLLAAGEALVRRGEVGEARRLLPPPEAFSPANRSRARALYAQLWPEEKERQQKELLLEAPREFPQAFPQADWEKLARGFEASQWARVAEGFLAAGDAPSALKAASRAGAAAVAAKAALVLRRSGEAQRWAERLPASSAERYLLLAQALRQQAWRAEGQERLAWFSRVAGAAREAEKRATGGERAEAQLLLAEALLEQGRWGEVPGLLKASAAFKPARWEWVARRALMAFAQRGTVLPLPPEAVGPRLSRLSAFWSGWLELRRKNPEPLRQLAASGHPDLPAQWAARLSRATVSWKAAQDPPSAPPPPPWATWWLRAGRVADVVLGWRAELEEARVTGPAWLGLVRLGEFPPQDAIPLLVRAEPRLFTGPWSGLSRELLVQYLPLPFRPELEAAAQAHGVPPWMLAGLVRQESAFNPRARSAKGAVGLAQLLPETAGFPARALEDPQTNLKAGAAFLAKLRQRFGSWEAALAAYNAGESRVWPAWERAGRQDGPFFVESLELPETWDYVHRVMLLAQGYRALYWPEAAPEGP